MIARYARSSSASASSPSTLASASARSAAGSRRAISTLAARGLSFTIRGKLSKVIVGSDQIEFLVHHDALQERLSGRQLGRELGGRIQARIDLAPQCFMGRSKGMGPRSTVAIVALFIRGSFSDVRDKCNGVKYTHVARQDQSIFALARQRFDRPVGVCQDVVCR